MLHYILVHTQYLAVLCALVLAFPIVWFHRSKIGISRPLPVLGVCLFLCAASVFSVMAFAFFESRITGFPQRIGAISVLGVYLFCPLILLAFSKISRLNTKGLFDCYALCAAVTLILMRINCIHAGCCQGICLPGSEMRVPVREIEIAFYALMFLWFLYRERKGYVEGTFFPLLMMLYGILRFILEWFREANTSSAFHLSHIWAIAAAVIGAGLYFGIRSRSKQNQSDEQ